MVTLSSIPSSTTKMLDVELSPNDGSEEVLEDSNDEAIIKTRVSNLGVHLARRSLMLQP